MDIGIGIGIGGEMNRIIRASSYGFSPSATGAENIIAWNSIPGGNNRTIVVDVAGTYTISNSLWLKSNTKYLFSAQCVIKKNTGSQFSHVFGNYGMLTLTRDENITFVAANLTVDINGIDIFSLTNTNISPVPRLRAQYQFYKVDNFIIDGFKVDSQAATQQFSMCICDCSYGNISNLDITNNKDGLDIISSHDLVIEDSVINTRDDATFVGTGYYSATPSFKSSYNITFQNMTIGSIISPDGYAARIYYSSWGNWTNGQSYILNEICINAGNVYQKEEAATLVASVAPTHTAGKVQGADGITWWWVQSGTANNASVYNILYKNITLTSNRSLADLGNNVVTTGTESNGGVSNITYDNIIFPLNYSNWAFKHSTIVNNVTFKNSSFESHDLLGGGGFFDQYTKNGARSITKFTIDTCTIDVKDGRLISVNETGNSFGELEVLNSAIDVSGSGLFYTSGNTGSLGKFTSVDSEITHEGIATNYLFTGTTNKFIGNSINCTRTKFIKLTRLWHTGVNNVSAVITLIDCEFVTSLAYVAVVTVTGCNIDIVSNGTKYIDPTGYLFFCNQLAATDSLNINLANSTGIVTAAKVRNGTGVVVTACDLPYV